MLSTLDALVQVVEFVYSAMKSYADTPEGQAHLDKIAVDLGLSEDTSADTNPLDMSAPVIGATSTPPRIIRS